MFIWWNSISYISIIHFTRIRNIECYALHFLQVRTTSSEIFSNKLLKYKYSRLIINDLVYTAQGSLQTSHSYQYLHTFQTHVFDLLLSDTFVEKFLYFWKENGTAWANATSSIKPWKHIIHHRKTYLKRSKYEPKRQLILLYISILSFLEQFNNIDSFYLP